MFGEGLGKGRGRRADGRLGKRGRRNDGVAVAEQECVDSGYILELEEDSVLWAQTCARKKGRSPRKLLKVTGAVSGPE